MIMDIQFKIDEQKRGSFFIENNHKQQIAELDFEIKDDVLMHIILGLEKN